MMHVVGRMYARRHHVTLANLQRNLPRSNDPGCSAGFGMGLVMALGGEIGRLGPDGALKICERAPTRFRSYTCIHSLGHAYMRLYHSQLGFALKACRTLPATAAPDCAQGAYHDYWFSAVGRDGTKRQRGGAANGTVTMRQADSRFRQAVLVPLLPRAPAEASAHERGRRPRAVSWACRHSASRLHFGGVADHVRRPVQADEASARGCEAPTPSAACTD